ncbi:unnamed protein product [Prorocentrum cordatum]|uniref:Uncharacterized protein n=1 Tax=Prorocentrum cordatum TaxID=2364126 RepID=A0ABN9ULE9_9DINO|nr:unnamed protein product [Polarella glacialis]
MTGAADARDAGACSPPRRDGAPSAVSTGDQSAATAAQVGGRRSPAEGGRRGGQGRLPLRGVRVGLGPDTYREDFGPERVRPAGSLYSVYEQLRRQRARERGRAKPKPRPKPVVAPDKLLPQETMLGGSSLHDRAKRDAALSPGCALQLLLLQS